MNVPFFNSLAIAAFSIVLGAILAFFVRLNKQIADLRDDMADATAQNAKENSELRVRMAELNTQVSPLWARVQAQISADLHHPDQKYHEMDKLLEHLESLTISDEERIRLKVLLIERSQDMDHDISEEQRKKALLMVTVMDMVLAEKAVATAGSSAVAMVSTIELEAAKKRPE